MILEEYPGRSHGGELPSNHEDGEKRSSHLVRNRPPSEDDCEESPGSVLSTSPLSSPATSASFSSTKSPTTGPFREIPKSLAEAQRRVIGINSPWCSLLPSLPSDDDHGTTPSENRSMVPFTGGGHKPTFGGSDTKSSIRDTEKCSPLPLRASMVDNEDPRFLKRIFVCFLAVLCVSGFLLFLLKVRMDSATVGKSLRIASACQSIDCAKAVAFLDSIGDLSVDPCTDFHSHVCGKWEEPNQRRGRYMSEVFANFTSRIHSQLTSKTAADGSTGTYNMAVFYSSCYSFMSTEQNLKHSLDTAVGSIPVALNSWMMARNFSDLFGLAVETTLNTGFPSVFNVSQRQEWIYIDLGTSLKSVFESVGVAHVNFTEVVASELRLPWQDPRFEVQDLDEKVHDILTGFTRPDFQKASARNLNGTGLAAQTWYSAFERVLPKMRTSFDLRSSILIRGAVELRHIIAVIRYADIKQTCAYLISVYLAHVLKYFFYKTHTSKQNDATDADLLCLSITARYWKTTYIRWLVTRFQPGNAASKAAVMYKLLKESVFELLRNSRKVVGELKRNAMINAVSNIKHVLYTNDVPYKYKGIPATSKDGKYTDDFVSNLITAAKGENRRLREVYYERRYPDHVWQSTPAVGYVPEYKVIVTSTPYLNPDMFYADADEVELNLATLGVTIAEGMIDAALAVDPDGTWRELVVGHLLGCFGGDFVTVRGEVLNMSSGIVEKLAAIVGALNAAFEVSRIASPNKTKQKDQLFFRRFCLRYCGDNGTSPAVGGMACNVAAANMHEFYVAFDCAPNKVVQCGSH